MRKLLRKIRQLVMGVVLILTLVCAAATILIPNTNLFSRIFWIGSPLIPALNFLFAPKRRSSKNGYKDHQGYIILDGTSEYEHRHIAKQILHRNLLPNEVVHHINGKRSDNRLINLCVMDRHQHELFHAWIDWKKKKSGSYPSFPEQKRLLRERHNGILLENQSAFRFNTYSQPVRHTFVINKPKIIPKERPEDFSRKLFAELRQERNRLANERNIPAYLVFKNFTLTEMARQLPQDSKAMESIIGVTPEKRRLYGDHFLAVIWKYKSDAEKLNKGSSVS